MPKMKTKKIIRKRFKISCGGKVFHRVQGARHLRRKKSKTRQRRQDKLTQVKKIRYIRMIKHYLEG